MPDNSRPLDVRAFVEEEGESGVLIRDLPDGRLAAVGTWSPVSLVYEFCSFAIVGGLCFNRLVMSTKMKSFTSSRNERDFRSTECNVWESAISAMRNGSA